MKPRYVEHMYWVSTVGCSAQHVLGAGNRRRNRSYNIAFKQGDVRNVNKEVYGEFDVIYCLGLLYHLHYPVVFDVLNNIFKICNKAVIIDTNISLRPTCYVSYNGMTYEGHINYEHGKDDPDSLVKARLAHSLTKEPSFLFTRQSLYCALYEMGFSSVYECYVPLEVSKPQFRITMAAMKSSKVKISSYPWLNDMTEEEISKLMLELGPWKDPWQIAPVESSPSRNIMSWSPKVVLKKCVKVILNKLGYEIHRINPST